MPIFKNGVFKNIAWLWNGFRRAVARQGLPAIPQIAGRYLLSTRLGHRWVARSARGKTVKAAEIPKYSRTYKVNLPEGYPARAVLITLSVPAIPPRPQFEFADHPTGAGGAATDLVLASAMGGFGISRDLGASWKYVEVEGQANRRIVHVKQIAPGRLLLQTTERVPDRSGPRAVDILIVDEDGKVVTSSRLAASPWHSSRSVDIAGGVLMFAEYPFEIANATPEQRDSSRVWRSRDEGLSWEVAFEVEDIRHFHFLQARPGHAREWWLTSGDADAESRIYVSKDDGDTWHDVTAGVENPLRIRGAYFPKTLFRLTDLGFAGDEVVWGTDDYLYAVKGAAQGARVFRSRCRDQLKPRVVGRSRWQIRNMVDVGDFFLILTQGGNRPDATMQEKMPGVFLMPKEEPESEDTPALFHLFDVDVHREIRTGFTYSRASRAWKDGVFFSYRGSTDAFPTGHKMLKWEVRFT
jgi:hypothetical protein